MNFLVRGVQFFGHFSGVSPLFMWNETYMDHGGLTVAIWNGQRYHGMGQFKDLSVSVLEGLSGVALLETRFDEG